MLPCPVCLEPTSSPLVTVADMPAVGCEFADSRAKALGAMRGTLELALCSTCGHIFNRAFEPELVTYGRDYENALDFSQRHRTHLDETVDRLIAGYALHHKSVLEIGCGAAQLLLSLCARGANHGVGYDPSQQPRTMQAGDGSVTIIADIFTGANQRPVDLVVSQHVLEHLADLNSVLRQACSVLKPGGIAYFEVPNGLAIFRDLSIWDLTYEHVSYFSPATLERALSATGFSLRRLESGFGGQYIEAEAVSGAATRSFPASSAAYPRDLGGFSAAFSEFVGSWKDHIAGLLESGCRIALWGAGAKAVSFLNMLAIGYSDGIEYVVDINPRKAGRFVPGTGQKIIPPDYLREYAPDVIIVMNREYGREIRAVVESMGLHCDLISASSAVA